MKTLLQSLKFTLLNTGYAKLNTKWDYDNVISPFTRLYYITKGNAKVYHNNQVFTLKPGYLYLIPSYTYSRYKCEEYHEQFYISFIEEIKNGLSIYNLKHFKYEVKATEIDRYYFDRLLALNPKRKLANDDPEVYDNRPSLLKFIKDNEALTAYDYMETQGILTILFSRFIENSNLVKSSSSNSKGLGDILSYIGENLHTALTVELLANYCNLSPDYFSRTFKEKFGMRPNKYIQSKRIERSQLLLLTTNNSLKQIAHKVGLENVSYFSRTFKNISGKTPAAFRKEQLGV